MIGTLRDAFSDIRAGFGLHRVWIALANEDIGDQHRRTTLGPLWLLINYLAFAFTFIFVVQQGASGTPNYPAHVAIGLLIWFYMAEIVAQAVSLFVREESFIKGTTLPLSVFVLRLCMQGLLRAGYALVGCIAILAFSGTAITVGWAWALVAILVLLAVTPAVVVIFAFLGAYFPDSQFIVSNLMRIGMFLTPVFWAYDGSGGIRHAFYWWNPFTYFIEIARVPIISGDVPIRSLWLCIGIGLACWVMALLLLGRLRKRVVFVL